MVRGNVLRKIYIFLAAAAVAAALMLAGAFYYIDIRKHQTYTYALSVNNTLIGFEKTDLYSTENKVTYKSFIVMPRDLLWPEITRRMTFTEGSHEFIEFERIRRNGRARASAYVAMRDGETVFVASDCGVAGYLDGVPAGPDYGIFERSVLFSYQQLLWKYKFRKRGEQFFNVLIPSDGFLPPRQNVASVTYIGADTVELNDKEVLADHLVVELKGEPLISVWTSKVLHIPLAVKIPAEGFSAFLVRKIWDMGPIEDYLPADKTYSEEEISIASGDIRLAGTLTMPAEGGPFPAVLLIPPDGPIDREGMGIYTDLSHTLSKEGFAAIRYDKRGVGKSAGSIETATAADAVSDILAAVDFICTQPEIDSGRIAVLGHGRGGYYALASASRSGKIGGCVIMSASAKALWNAQGFEAIRAMASVYSESDPGYPDTVAASAKETADLAVAGGRAWAVLAGKRVCVKPVRALLDEDPVQAAGKASAPVLILHGLKDNINMPAEAKLLMDSLGKAAGPRNLIFYNDLGYYFGRFVRDGKRRDHYEVNSKALGDIAGWLKKSLVPPPAQETEAESLPQTVAP